MAISLGPQFTQRIYNWTAWKAVYAIKGSLFQYDDDGILYTIWAYDGPDVHLCQIWKGEVPYTTLVNYSQYQNDTDKTEFETSYKSLGNLALTQSDTDGAAIVRNKAAKKGWTFCSLPFEFETSRLSDTLYSKDSSGTDRTFITMKAYNAGGTEVTTAGLLNANYATIVKTVIDFEPPFDYEIIGGDLRTSNIITDDVRLWIVAAPDIAAPTGSKEMGGGINLKYLAPGNVFSVDGRVSKYATYNATYHTSKIRFILKYPAGTNEGLMTVIQLYKQ